jgi:hypothetical protein
MDKLAKNMYAMAFRGTVYCPSPASILRKDWSKKEDGERENWKIQIIVAVGVP